MKNTWKRIVSLLLAVIAVLSITACTPEDPQPGRTYDVPALVQSILKQVAFADDLEAVGDSAALYFPDLPENAKVELYTGSGYFADEVALITLASAADRKAGRSSVDAHLAQLRSQFQNYIPEEVGKIDKAHVWEYEQYLLVCITDGVAGVKQILEHAYDPAWQLPGSQNPSTSQPAGSTPPVSTPPVTSTPPETSLPATKPTQPQDPSLRPDGYPLLTSQEGKYEMLPGGSMRVDNAAFETYGFSQGVASTYASLVSKVAASLKGKTTVYSLPIPTSFGVKLPDDIQAIYPNYPNQGADIDTILSMMDPSVVPVRCFDNLMRHRDEYLYFRTDHHWNGIGAYYAYEAFCEAKGIAPYTMAQREEKQFDNFLGTLYINAKKPESLLPSDTVFAYKPYSQSASMVFYDTKGTEHKWSIISDVSKYQSGNKYSTFAGADNPLAVFTNPEVTDGSVCIVVKESYGNALLPYLVDHYSIIYEVDYRYWTGDLAEYARQVGANDMIFANNVMMISTGILVGMLDKVVG